MSPRVDREGDRIPLNAWPELVAAVAVAVTVAAPLLLMLVAFSSRVRRAAVGSVLPFGSAPVSGEETSTAATTAARSEQGGRQQTQDEVERLFHTVARRQSLCLGLSEPRCGR
jgi:H2-forming N5,N10-methylenetetrahydromethanopterin dehydrogenase-like enzyme